MVVGNLKQETELAIIGAGPGGYVAAIRAADLGKEVLLGPSPFPPNGLKGDKETSAKKIRLVSNHVNAINSDAAPKSVNHVFIIGV